MCQRFSKPSYLLGIFSVFNMFFTPVQLYIIRSSQIYDKIISYWNFYRKKYITHPDNYRDWPFSVQPCPSGKAGLRNNFTKVFF